MKKNIKTYIILVLLTIIVGLIIFGVFYAIKNHNRSEIMTLDNIDIKRTIGNNQLDVIKQPTVNLPLIYDKLPEVKSTIQEISYKTFNKLFQTKGKSILIIVKDECSFCDEYLPIVEETFKELNINAYKINLTKLSSNEIKDILNYIDYDGTPTTYILNNGSAKHSLTGTVDKDTLKAYIDYFYTRDN